MGSKSKRGSGKRKIPATTLDESQMGDTMEPKKRSRLTEEELSLSVIPPPPPPPSIEAPSDAVVTVDMLAALFDELKGSDNFFPDSQAMCSALAPKRERRSVSSVLKWKPSLLHGSFFVQMLVNHFAGIVDDPVKVSHLFNREKSIKGEDGCLRKVLTKTLALMGVDNDNQYAKLIKGDDGYNAWFELVAKALSEKRLVVENGVTVHKPYTMAIFCGMVLKMLLYSKAAFLDQNLQELPSCKDLDILEQLYYTEIEGKTSISLIGKALELPEEVKSGLIPTGDSQSSPGVPVVRKSKRIISKHDVLDHPQRDVSPQKRNKTDSIQTQMNYSCSNAITGSEVAIINSSPHHPSTSKPFKVPLSDTKTPTFFLGGKVECTRTYLYAIVKNLIQYNFPADITAVIKILKAVDQVLEKDE